MLAPVVYPAPIQTPKLVLPADGLVFDAGPNLYNYGGRMHTTPGRFGLSHGSLAVPAFLDTAHGGVETLAAQRFVRIVDSIGEGTVLGYSFSTLVHATNTPNDLAAHYNLEGLADAVEGQVSGNLYVRDVVGVAGRGYVREGSNYHPRGGYFEANLLSTNPGARAIGAEIGVRQGSGREAPWVWSGTGERDYFHAGAVDLSIALVVGGSTMTNSAVSDPLASRYCSAGIYFQWGGAYGLPGEAQQYGKLRQGLVFGPDSIASDGLFFAPRSIEDGGRVMDTAYLSPTITPLRLAAGAFIRAKPPIWSADQSDRELIGLAADATTRLYASGNGYMGQPGQPREASYLLIMSRGDNAEIARFDDDGTTQTVRATMNLSVAGAHDFGGLRGGIALKNAMRPPAAPRIGEGVVLWAENGQLWGMGASGVRTCLMR